MSTISLAVLGSTVPVAGDATPIVLIAIIAGIGLGIVAVTLLLRRHLK
jgi:hypothetical protein